MDIVIWIFILVGGSIAFSAWMNRKPSDEPLSPDNHHDSDNSSSIRKCVSCGNEGEMKTWLSNYSIPKLIAIVGFLLGYIPGLIFLALYWGKYKCPRCGAVGKNHVIHTG